VLEDEQFGQIILCIPPDTFNSSNLIFFRVPIVYSNKTSKLFTKKRNEVEIVGTYLLTTTDITEPLLSSNAILYHNQLATSEPIVPYRNRLLISGYELHNSKDRAILYDIVSDEIFTIIGQDDDLEFQEPSTCQWYNLLISIMRVPFKTGSRLYVVYADGAKPHYTGLDGVSPNLITLSNNHLVSSGFIALFLYFLSKNTSKNLVDTTKLKIE